MVDLQEEIPIEIWNKTCKKAQTANTRLKLLQYNWLIRVYITPEKLNPNKLDLCNRCREDKGKFFQELGNLETSSGLVVQRFYQSIIIASAAEVI